MPKLFQILRARNQSEDIWWNRCKDFAINNGSYKLLNVIKEFELSMSCGLLECDDGFKQIIDSHDEDIDGSCYVASASCLECL